MACEWALILHQEIALDESALTGELKIVRMDHCTSPAKGGREIFLLVERVTKKNIKVRFYELDDNNEVVWEGDGHFNDLHVHHQYAIVLRTPAYRDINIRSPVHVFMELVRPSDNARSESKEFTYIPCALNGKPGTKRSRPNDFDSSEYDTSNSVGSAAIPCTVRNMSQGIDDMRLSEIDSNELNKMILEYGTKEFEQMYEENKDEYELAFSDIGIFTNISTDCGANKNSKKSNTPLNKTYKDKVRRCVEDITEFLRSKPTIAEIIKYIRLSILNVPGDYNAFHMAAMIGDIRAIQMFINLIMKYEQLDIVNIPTKTGQGTALHIAVLCGDVELLRALVKCKADVSITDRNLNTPLHLASEHGSGDMTKYLMVGLNAKRCIDSKNKNGNTALHRAVKRGNLKAVEVLCNNGADVNCAHPTSGYSPLRFAVENGDIEIIKYLLLQKADPLQTDFGGVNPLQVITEMDLKEVKELIRKNMIEHNISYQEEIDVKLEPEEDESEDEMEIYEEDIKAEPLPLVEDDQQLDHFTDECVDEIAKHIDSSGKWEDLARLLDIDYLLRMETINENSPGKRILSVAVQVATVKEIRGFLEDLDETLAVQAIDRMASSSKMQCE